MPLTYLYPNRKAWQKHVKTLETEEQLTKAIELLDSARIRVGVHPFLQTDEIGLAKWDVDQQAKAKGFSVYRNHTYRKPLTPQAK